jgi:aryl-alcohol dehydrogenase-like predicted oxidoreductase
LENRKIGSLDVSVVGLGCNNFGWRIDAAAASAVVGAALDAGINFFDTADIYCSGKSEEFLGRALGARRSAIVLATKFGMKFDEHRSGAKPAYVRQALEDSLRRLGTDYIDLYQLHQPDPATPIADTLGALDDLVKAGKVREIGCSNFSAAQLREAGLAAVPAVDQKSGARFASVQNNYSLMHREPEAEVLPECERERIAFIPYFPLANGLLSGKYRRGEPLPSGSRGADGFGPKMFTDGNLAKAEALADYADRRGRTLLELAISWLVAHRPVASVIAGARTAVQVRANAVAAGWRLSASEMSEVTKLL